MATSTAPSRAQAPKPVEPSDTEPLPLEERIRRRAHEIWMENGSPAETDLIDWLEPEQEILSEQGK